MDADSVLSVLDRLDREGVRWWIDGGWGVDALAGRQTRPHDDVDVVVADEDRPRIERALAELGYAHDAGASPGLPARYVLRDAAGRQVDLHLIRFDARGNGWQALDGGAWGAYPGDGLTGVGMVGGRRVRCATPQLQLSHHLGYMPEDDDRHDLHLLRQEFGIGLPPGL
ncbi:MAG TPA: amino acid transporter [Candidatus Dormibacteraeota bacterium]|nr:amino acid transporter [Candidatus Dormibacteraeota bacterium]